MRLPLLFVLTFLTLASLHGRVAAQPLPTPTAQVEDVTEYRLPNGLQVLLVPDGSKPTTTVNLTYRVGSRHESYGETGMAHLLEHLLFKGTPSTPDEWAEFSRRGMRPNGSTSFDRTNYFASFAANDDTLRWYLGWQADAMVNSFIARKDLDTEMTVVRNEFEAGENNPGRVLMQQTLAAAYHWHNYGKATIGARSDIENVDIPRLQAFYRLHYQPDNATLTIAGRFDPVQTLAWVTQAYAGIPKPTRVLPATYTLDPPQDGERQVTVRRIGGTPTINMAFPVMAGSDPEFAAAQLLASILGDTPGGRLHQRLVKRGLAAQTFAFALQLAEPSPLILGASLAPGQDLDRARAEMVRVVDGLRTEPVTKAELERARKQWLNDWAEGHSDPERIGVALSEAIANGDWRLYFLQRDQVRKLKLADVQRVAVQWLRPDNRTVGLYRPTAQPERAPQGRRVDVAALVQGYRGDAAEAAVEAFEATPANIDQRTQLSQLKGSGLKLALLPKGTRGQAVQAQLLLHFGTGDRLKGQETVSAFVASLLDKGAAGLSRQQTADQFDQLQTSVAIGGSGQTVSVNFTSKRDQLPAAIALVGRLLRQPAFSADALQELRGQWLAGIQAQRDEPQAVLGQLLSRHGNPYPRGDLRYPSSFDEQVQDVKAVTAEQLRAFHRRFYSAALGEFSAVGDFDPAAVQAAVQQALGDWKQPAAGPQPYERQPQPLVAVTPQRYMARTPDKANASFQAQLALPLTDLNPDFAALAVANFIFGQGPDSRLWQRVRGREGLSYGVGSGIDWSPDDANSGFSIHAIFAPQNQAAVESAVMDELQRSLRDGYTEAEVASARSGLLNARRLSRAQDAVVTARLAANLRLQRRFALSQQVDEAIAAVTVEQVNAAWRRYIDPARLVQGYAGDFKP
jgi:zinc protease